MTFFQSTKLAIIEFTGLPQDALHIHVGLALFFGSALLLRWRVGGWRPWLLVLVATLAGEAWDMRDNLSLDWGFRLASHWHDIWNTMLWPTLVMLGVRWRDRLHPRALREDGAGRIDSEPV